MKIKDLFAKDIFRNINGVVKVQENKDDVIWQELEEFVVTKELRKHFDKFIGTYAPKNDQDNEQALAGKIGIWTSGFFGSGKSHFIKILSYLLENRQVVNPVDNKSKKAVEFFEDKIEDQMFLGDLKRVSGLNTETILFNIDSKAVKTNERSAILETFWRVFNEHQGFASDRTIAELEYQLSKQNKYDEFCKVFKEANGKEWHEERDSYYLIKEQVVKILTNIFDSSSENISDWLDSLENNLELTIEKFANRVKEYIDRNKSKNRIMFLVDEVGQFIGNDTHMMLELQTLVEDLGTICQGRAWVLVTSQEDIDTILGDLNSTKAYDFSKIQGRFKTRLSLSSSNTDEVIQKRLLKKKPDVIHDLESMYNDKKDIVRSQLSFTSDNPTLHNFTNENEFTSNYPFIPYQFVLVQNIFEAIRRSGATGLHLSRGERSLLDAFQLAAQEVSEEEIGKLVPLYSFYPCIESFLDTNVKRGIDQARENKGLEVPFDTKILETLFLIRYVKLVKPNIDNLVTLCIDTVDADRLQLKEQIEASLARLEKEHLISKSGDHYFFLTDEEREIEKEIKNTEIDSSAENKFMAELIFNDILKGKDKHRYPDYKRDYDFTRICDSLPFGTKTEQDIAIEFLTPISDQYSEFNDMKCNAHTTANYRALIKLKDITDIGEELRKFLQTKKYIRLNSDASASDTQKRILADKAAENRSRRSHLINLINESIIESELFALGHKFQDIKSANSPQTIVDKALNYLIENTFTKFNYLETLHDDPNKEIKSILQSDDIGAESLGLDIKQKHPQDIQEIEHVIDLQSSKNQQVILNDLVNKFSSKPYGWPVFEVVLLIAKLFVAGKIDLVHEGSKISPREAVNPLTNTHKWKNIKILKRKQHNPADIKQARELGRELFGTMGPESQDELTRFLKDRLEKWQKELEDNKIKAEAGHFPGLEEIKEGLETIKKLIVIYDSFEFINSFNEHKEKLEELNQNLQDVSGFYQNQMDTWRDLIKAIDKYSPNQDEINKYPEAKKSLERLSNIKEESRPYSSLKEVNNLIAKVEAANKEVLEKKRTEAIKEIDKTIEEIGNLLGEAKIDDDFKNKVFHPIQELKKRVQDEENIRNISYELNKVKEEFNNAVAEINDYFSKQQEGSEELDKPKIQIENFRPSSLANKRILETEDDVNEYTNKLKDHLVKLIKENKKIQIQ